MSGTPWMIPPPGAADGSLHWVRMPDAPPTVMRWAGAHWQSIGWRGFTSPSQAGAYGWEWGGECEPPHDGLQDRGA